MRIIDLSVENFRGFQTRTLPVTAARRIYIAGETGQGKTSTREAVKWLLTGRALGLDDAGRGIKDGIRRQDAPETGPVAVSALIERPATASRPAVRLRVSRRWAGETTLALDEQAYGVADGQDALCQILGCDLWTILACLDITTLTRLKHADAKALLMAVLNVRVAYQDETLTIDQIATRHKQAFDERTVERRRLQRCVIPPAPEFDPPDVSALQRKLDALLSEHAALKTVFDQKGGARLVLEEQRTAVRARLGELQAARESLGDVESVRATTEQRATRIRQQLAELDATADLGVSVDLVEVEVADTVLAALAAALVRPVLPTDVVDTCRAHDPTAGCVLSSRIPCATPVKAFRDIAATLVKEDKQATKLLETRRPSLLLAQELVREYVRLQTVDLPRVGKTVAAADDLQQRVEQALLDRDAIELQLADAIDLSGARAQLDVLDTRIAKGRETIATATRLVEADRAHRTAKAERDALEATLATLERRIQTYGPGGIQNAALEVALAVFLDEVNGPLKDLGWALSFSLDPWRILANGRPLETWSEAQQLVLGAALQLAIAKLTGFSFAIIDAIDHLDTTRRTAFTRMVLASPIDQVIVLAARDADAALPQVQGVDAVRL